MEETGFNQIQRIETHRRSEAKSASLLLRVKKVYVELAVLVAIIPINAVIC